MVTTKTFVPRQPVPVCWGFEAGVLRIAWTREPSFEIAGRDGRVYTATITECQTYTTTLPSEAVNKALLNLIVRSPDGALARVTGVEMFCTMCQVVGARLGILLVPMEEP